MVEVLPRGKRPAGVPFGRSELGVPAGDLTDLGCPDCRGVLAVREEGHQGHLAFTCRVGHAFSGESLLKVKEEQVEDAMWSTIELFEELVLLHRELAARAEVNGVQHLARAFRQRIKRAEANMASLRAVIAKDSPADTDRRQG